MPFNLHFFFFSNYRHKLDLYFATIIILFAKQMRTANWRTKTETQRPENYSGRGIRLHLLYVLITLLLLTIILTFFFYLFFFLISINCVQNVFRQIIVIYLLYIHAIMMPSGAFTSMTFDNNCEFVL